VSAYHHEVLGNIAQVFAAQFRIVDHRIRILRIKGLTGSKSGFSGLKD
jgi:hypothetical protein